MKKQGTRIISLFIILMLFIGFVPETCLPRLFTVKAHAEEIPAAFSLEESPLGKEMQDGQWRFALREEDGYAVITGYDDKEPVISVPEYLGGYDVVGVASDALTEQAQVTLPGTVYYLAEDAFGKTTPEIVAPNGSYALWWASTHGFTYRTGKDYELVPGVIDYTDASSWRVRKRGESNVAFDALTAMPLTVGSLFLMRDTRGMDFFFRVVELRPEGDGMLASVEVPKVSEVFINYETTVDVALTRDDFIPAEGVTVEKNSSLLRSVSSGSDTTTTPISASISGKTKGGMAWSGSAGGNFKETVTYTVTIVNGEITNTELTKTESNEFFIKLECSGATKLLTEKNKARALAEKKAKGETITQEEYDWLDDFRIGCKIDHLSSDTLSLSDLEAYSKALDAYEKVLDSDSHIDHSSKLGEYRLQTPYFNIAIRADVSFSVSGTLTYTFTDNTVTRQHYDSATEEWVVDDAYSSVFSGDTSHTLTAQIKGSISFKIELSVGAAFLSNLSAELEVGLEATAKKVVALNGRNFNNCTELAIAPYATFNVYAGVWVGKNYGPKIQIYSNKWTAQDLMGKEYLWKAHFNAALQEWTHLPEDCPLKGAYTVHYQTRCGITVKDRDIFPGGALTSAYNPNLNEDPHVSSTVWMAGAFLGWAWNPADTIPTAASVGGDFGSPRFGDTPYYPTAGCTVYDVWENMATVSFDSNGGSTVESQVVPIGGHILRPDDPIKDNKHILAWKTQNGTVWNFAWDTVSVDMTLIADWGDGDPEPGGTEKYWYLGNYGDVSIDCIIDPYHEGESAATYFKYEELEIADGIKGIRITGLKNNPVYLVVPARLPSLSNEHATLDVVDIADGAFSYCSSLRSAYFLTDNLKQFTANRLFAGCTNLEYVEAPALENGKIGDRMFSGCTNLKFIMFRSGVRSIGESAFSGTGISSLYIPAEIDIIPSHAFSACNSLTSLNFSYPIATIENRAFAGCVNLKSVDLNMVTSIKGYAFSDCTSLQELDLNGVESIGYNAFQNCTGLENLYIPDSVKELTDYTSGPFNGCTGLKEISVGGVEELTGGMLKTGSQNLEKLTIRGTVKTIGHHAFDSSPYNGGPYFKIDNGYSFSDHPVKLIIEEGVTSIGEKAFYNCGMFTSVSFPSTVVNIGDWAFSDCYSLTEVTIPMRARICHASFSNCNELMRVTISEGVTRISDYAFSGCNNLKNIAIASTVTSIGDYSFSNCASMNSITIPNNVVQIGEYAFGDCTALENILVLCGGQPFDSNSLIGCTNLTIHIGGEENLYLERYCEECGISYDYTINHHDLRLILNNGESNIVQSVRWEDPLTLPMPAWSGHIFVGWFYDEALTERCTHLTMPARDLTLYAKWRNAAQNALYHMDGDHVTLLRYMEVEDENSVLYLPDTVDGLPLTTIAAGAFADSGITELHIPASVTDIATAAFAGSSLCVFSVSPDNSVYRSINSVIYSKDGTELLFFPPMIHTAMVPAGVTRIGPYAFDSSQLDSVAFHEGLLEVGERAFRNTQLTELELPESLKTIGERAFSDCGDLHYIEAAGSPTMIGDNAFVGCSPFLAVYGPNEDCALRTAIRGGGYRYNAYTLTLEAPLRTIKRVCDACTELMLPTNPETAENECFIGWFADYWKLEPFTGTVMPAQDLTLYAGTETIYEYETITDPDNDEIIGLRITGCHAPDAEITVPDAIGGVPVSAVAAGAFGLTYTRVTLPSAVSEIEAGAFAANTVLVCAPGGSAEAAALAAGYNIGVRSWTLRWESGFAMTPDSTQLNAGEAIIAPSIERSGYELAGWYYDEDLTEALTEGDVMLTHDVTLYADWNVTDEETAQIADNLRWTLNGETITVTGYTGTGTVLTIPASLHGKTVTAVAPNAFAYNNTVTEIVLPDTIATLGEKAFFSMRNLSSLTLPTGLKTLPADVLNGCASLETIALPEGLESIAGSALANSGLTELSLPASLLTIHSSALRGCADLSEIHVTDGNPYFESRDGVLFDTADGILVKYPAAKTDVSYTVCDTWSIGAWAFENAQALQEVIIDTEIYSLGAGAFRNCTGLTALPELGEYVSKIPDECFYGCASLSSEVLPESVRELGRYALANSGLRELTVSDQLTRIGAFAVGSEVLLRGESGCYAETWASDNGVVFIPTSAATVEIITLLETRIALNLGERTALTPTVTPAEAGSGNLQYLSADESIVRVDENGQIYAVGGGTTTVFVSAPGGAETSCIVTVEIVLESFRLAVKGRITGIPRDSLSLGAQIKPDKLENKEIRYSSSNPSVAEVSEDGTITMLENGAALITAVPAADETMAKAVLVLCGLDNQLRLPAALTSLEAEAMSGSGAEYVLLPGTMETIGARAFANCGSLYLAEFSTASVNLGENVFLNCPSLTILAPAGGSVERYAADHNIPFIALESISTD